MGATKIDVMIETMTQTTIHKLTTISDPQTLFAHYARSDTAVCVSFTYTHKQKYLSANSEVLLFVVCLLHDSRIQCLIRKKNDAPTLDKIDLQLTAERYFNEVEMLWAREGIMLESAWPLSTINIPKPWGAEIWYTGMEDRGVCQVSATPLPWLLSLINLGHDEVDASFESEGPILLKILDPYPDPNTGDLYFELHEKKTEVYIVTSIDHSVWSDGVGKIRYGFNQDKKNSFNTVKEFKAAYLESVTAYKTVRDQIDIILHDRISHENANNDLIPESLILNEQLLKDEMYSYTNLKSLRVGDVIHVHPYFPHSLQHGVRVIEFQTAHYERFILSFTQKVVTQNHWDTNQGLELANTTLPSDQLLTIIEKSEGVCLERIAEFEQFSAYRLSLENSASYKMNFKRYLLAIGIKSTSSIENTWGEITHLTPEEGFFIPATAAEITITAADDQTVLLLAIPN
ncbi:MAG: hypothetical protein ACI9FB_001585 [Candidatus Azotimanducaceae bacterium]|jgi:hypothetical protein